MRNADESQKSKHDKRCAMTVATRVSSAGRASDAHRDRQVFHHKVVRNPRHYPVELYGLVVSESSNSYMIVHFRGSAYLSSRHAPPKRPLMAPRTLPVLGHTEWCWVRP